jgi:hypothetical protein
MEKRYPALHTISVLLKVISVLIIALSAIFLIISIMEKGGMIYFSDFESLPIIALLSLPGSLFLFLVALIAALILWAYADLLVCLMDIEVNTREAAFNTKRNKVSILLDVPTDKNPAKPVVPNDHPENTKPATADESKVSSSSETQAPNTENPTTIENTTTKKKQKFEDRFEDFINKKLW